MHGGEQLCCDWLIECALPDSKSDVVRCRKDVRLPVQLQRAMAAEAEATREARAKVTVFFIGVARKISTLTNNNSNYPSLIKVI